jgi:transcriptional regulator with XRE-family HTH domain
MVAGQEAAAVERRMSTDDSAAQSYSRRVGARLLAVRKQRRLSRQAVERLSDGEFKASVVCAYERGERSVSVPRLQRLAAFYQVPVDSLLPPDREGTPTDAPAEHAPIRVDLGRLQLLEGAEGALLCRYLRQLQQQRSVDNGEFIAIRDGDLGVIASMLGTSRAVAAELLSPAEATLAS